MDSPSFGRIGPVPYARTGGHVNRGFAIIKASGCPPGSTLPPGHVRNLAPTILALLGRPASKNLDSLLLTSERAAQSPVMKGAALEDVAQSS